MDLFENYEKELQLAVDTATKKVRQLSSVAGERRKIILQEIDAEIENIRDLMDNMRHVARNSRGSDAMNVRIKDYDRKVDVLTRELNATRNQTNRSDLMAGATGRKFGDIEAQEGDQRQKILSGNQKLFDGSERLNETQRIAYESEAIGTQTIIDLKRQKDTLLRARDGLDDIDDNVTTTRKVLGAMSRRVATNNVILALIIIILFSTIGLIVWFKWLRKLIG
jgi:vesicle transport through interaction with t-SNAREs protein 1